MSTYNISPALNKNKVFLINLSELLGRLDPAYNIAIRNSDLRTKYPTEQIGKLVKSFSGGTPSKANPEFWEGNILWASPKDFKDFYLTDTEDRISESALSDSSTILAPANSLLIVVRSGVLIHTIPIAVTKLPMAINQDLKALIPDNRILPEYLGIYFRIYNDKLLPLIVKHSTTVQSINTEQFEKLKIPIPPKNIQQQIISIYKEALQIKKQNEAEAEKRLASIDDYLLTELGIDLPTPPENTLKNRMFTRTIREISGNRYDPRYFSSKYTKLIKSLNNGIYKTIRLKKYIKHLSMGISIPDYKSDVNEVPFILGKNLKKGYLELVELEYISNEINSANQSSIIRENDILFSVRGVYIGKVAVVPKAIEGANIINNIVKITLENINPHFVVAYFNSNIGQEFIYREVWGGAQPGFTNEQIKNCILPNPPLAKQKEIADHITGIRQQAQQLKEKTKEALSKASQEIEKILLA